MKQGRASSSGPGARKEEPISYSVSKGGVSRIGAHQSDMSMDPHLEGQARTSPSQGPIIVSKHGSQGKH